MSKFQLRDYQLRCKNLISERFRYGDNKVLAWLNTGAGKGLLMADFVQEAINKGMPVLSVMRRREIILQTIKNYKKYYGIESNPIMGNLKHGQNNLSTVASIDTLRNRIKNPKYDYLRNNQLVIIDEAHDLTSSTYKRLIWFLEGLNLNDFDEKKFEEQKQFFKKVYIGLTATPFRVGKRTHTFWQSVVKPIEAHELRDRGFLVDATVYAPKKIDTTGLRIDTKTGDFNQKEIFERVSKLQVIGDVVETYKKFGENKAAICFCVNQQHSKIMAEAFRRAGVPAVHCDADHSQDERNKAISGLKNGKYKILTNCNIFSTGFDAPFIEIEICARPTDSENLFIQQIGRVLRPYKVCDNCGTEYGGDDKCYQCKSTLVKYEKRRAIILDHANNTSRWGLPYDIRMAELEPIDSARKNSYKGTGVKDCPKCFAVLHANERYCVCGHDFVQTMEQNSYDQVINVKGELHEVDANFLKEKLYQKIKQKYNSLKRVEMLRGFDEKWKWHKLYDEFGEDFFDFSSSFGMPFKFKKKLQDDELEKGIGQFIGNVRFENDKVFN